MKYVTERIMLLTVATTPYWDVGWFTLTGTIFETLFCILC